MSERKKSFTFRDEVEIDDPSEENAIELLKEVLKEQVKWL